MNLKEAEKIWRESQPLEANGLVAKKPFMLAAYKNKKRLKQNAKNPTA